MKTLRTLRSACVLVLVAGLPACASPETDEAEDGSAAVSKKYNTFEASFSGQCTGSEKPRVGFQVRMDWGWFNSNTQTAPGDFTVRDAAGKEIAKKQVTLRRNGAVTGSDENVELDLPPDTKPGKLSIDLMVDFDALGLTESSAEYGQIGEIVRGTSIRDVRSLCSKPAADQSWSLELDVAEANPTASLLLDKMVAQAFSKDGFADVFKAPISSTTCAGSETGLPRAGKLNVSGAAAGRVAVLYKRNNFVGDPKKAYRILIVQRNFNGMGRDGALDAPKATEPAPHFEDIVGIGVATFGNRLQLSLTNPVCQ